MAARSSCYRAAAYDADGEDTGPAGLQVRRPIACLLEAVLWDVAAGQQEPVVIMGQLTGQPGGSRPGSDENEHAGDRELGLPGFACPPEPQAREPPVPGQAEDVRPVRTSILGFRSIRSTRYRDMEVLSESPRMIMYTTAPDRLRNSAACPAEFAAADDRHRSGAAGLQVRANEGPATSATPRVPRLATALTQQRGQLTAPLDPRALGKCV